MSLLKAKVSENLIKQKMLSKQLNSLHLLYTGPEKNKVIFSGIQPTGVPHIGNYYGALRNWVDLQTPSTPEGKHTVYYSIVSLHALTSPNTKVISNLASNILDSAATLLAVGIDPNKSILFRQSDVLEHAQLSWVLGSLAPVGELGRMTQWKTKKAEQDLQAKSHGDMGLFTYPVLQAADILLYHATHVPVGQDQRQHLELTRFLAGRYNNMYSKKYFTSPKAIYTDGAKVFSLTKPTNKMSKSAQDRHSTIGLLDSPELIKENIMNATTDDIPFVTYDPDKRPGITNLLQLLSLVLNSSIKETSASYLEKPQSQLKADLAEALIAQLSPIRESYSKLRSEEAFLCKTLQEGADKARSVASDTIEEVYKHLGM
ncbi:Tryptophan--tRNA ligase, mitochondrial [Entomophthora muscae]|uniref:Tryptophan--tRNA ligase, mitochondrial n=1 Tax=Entomophthora muscae TaxID=34485 RepID=A0ACC2U3A3_9FUNG|nr:Tryptophan--tRNA ligase, mitochondrial [Entomophthora muscae]